ncbi:MULTISPECIES: site-specific integrase [unclassified Rhodanobacter]|uniref:tyrosine-type recombinase/integrase n=1 Tax=unclassified Rhodanobacter TaxID=2621553 RepID=UPI001BE0D28C|nr:MULTISPECIES: site-specific integrase [unclassified Rhodanobacter]MBT2144895.1 site-specific integrase [Rhodanobacter sp. LX-99]MBT2148940.1 site-specific integrase [Rhodanobacter sp. LX-100]
MVGSIRRHARDVSPKDVQRFLRWVSIEGRHRERNRVIACLSFFAGLRASEIAQARWRMVLDAEGEVGETLRLENEAAKKLSGRVIPLKAETREALAEYLTTFDQSPSREDFILRSERGGRMRAQSIVNWFREVYASLGIAGASSHSGRRHFVTMAARRISEAGGSLRDIQELAGHRALSTTQLYIAHNTDAQKRVVDLI